MQIVVTPQARHRGRISIYGGKMLHPDPAVIARGMLADLGFGPYIATFESASELAFDWPADLREDVASWPATEVWFEADWRHTVVPQVEDPYFALRLAALEPSWVITDMRPACWPDAMSQPPSGLGWCSTVVPRVPGPSKPPADPPAPLPDQPGTGDPPEGGEKPQRAPWAAVGWFAAGAGVVAAAVYAYRQYASDKAERLPDIYEVNPIGSKCEGCGRRSRAAGKYCRTCRAELHRLVREAEKRGWIIGDGAQAGWIFDSRGEVVSFGHANLLEGLRRALEQQ